tara:strand:- start:659 stop:901 length:243 start_codon:yes stop_codon:yes gene_type:complete
MRHLGFPVPSGVPEDLLDECGIEMHPPAMVDLETFARVVAAVHAAAADELAGANTALSSTSAAQVRNRDGAPRVPICGSW